MAICLNWSDLAQNVNMHATFVASGPGIRKQNPVAGVRAVDLAPTLAFLMNIPGPQMPAANYQPHREAWSV